MNSQWVLYSAVDRYLRDDGGAQCELARIASGLRLLAVGEPRSRDNGLAMTLDEVGAALGISRERVRMIEAKALRKLRHPSRSRMLRPFIENDSEAFLERKYQEIQDEIDAERRRQDLWYEPARTQ